MTPSPENNEAKRSFEALARSCVCGRKLLLHDGSRHEYGPCDCPWPIDELTALRAETDKLRAERDRLRNEAQAEVLGQCSPIQQRNRDASVTALIQFGKHANLANDALHQQLTNAIDERNIARKESTALAEQLAVVTQERDEARAKIAKVMRLVDLAEAATDAQTEQEVAHSASFNEALALETLAMTEQERDALRQRITDLEGRYDRLAADYSEAVAGETEMQELARLRQRVTELEAALGHVKACFDAAFCEGLQALLNEGGPLAELIQRRLCYDLPARLDAALAATAPDAQSGAYSSTPDGRAGLAP